MLSLPKLIMRRALRLTRFTISFCSVKSKEPCIFYSKPNSCINSDKYPADNGLATHRITKRFCPDFRAYLLPFCKFRFCSFFWLGHSDSYNRLCQPTQKPQRKRLPLTNRASSYLSSKIASKSACKPKTSSR